MYKDMMPQELSAFRKELRMWYAGIDWADAHHDALVIDETGQRVSSLRVAHTPEGLSHLISFLSSIAPNKEQMACIIETNHGLLIATLLEAGFPVYPVNPKTVDRRRSASGAKTDTIDAYLLAKTGRADLADLRQLKPDSPVVAELKALTRDQDALIQSQTRLVNQLTACLKAYYPVALQLFTKLHQPITLKFLHTYPTPQAAQVASVEQIAALLKSSRHPTPVKTAQRIWHTLQQPHLQADAITTRTKSRLMLALVVQLVPLLEQIAAYDKEISTLFLTHADQEVFSSLPGAGKRLAPRILAEWGDDRERYSDANSVQALAGTSPVAYESGNYSKPHKRSACIKPLRNALQQFARQSTKQEAWALAYYQRKRTEGKSHSMALRALANVWVRLLYAMWLKHECYETATFEAAQHTHARPAA
jgi:transposase